MPKVLIEKEHYRPDEVAILFSVTVQTVRRWIRAKRIDHVHGPGGYLRIPRTEIEKFLRNDTR